MRLSIIIITYQGANLLNDCLDSIRPCFSDPETEVIVVDNGSTDGTSELVKERFPQVRLHILPKNMGVAFARNRGIEQTSGQYILLLDNDTIASAEAIQKLVTWLENHPECGICGCALIGLDGEVQESFKPFPGLRSKLRHILNLGENNSEEKIYLIGACQLFRRTLIQEIGLLNEKIFYGPEDADFCIRARKAGYSIQYLPEISIKHHWQRASRKRFSLTIKHITALLRFYFTHRRFW